MLDVDTSNGADAGVGIDPSEGLTADTVIGIEIDTPPFSSSCYSNNSSLRVFRPTVLASDP